MGAKKEKKESISVRMGGCWRNGVVWSGSGGRMTGWGTSSHPPSPYICHRGGFLCASGDTRDPRQKAMLIEFITMHGALSVRIQAQVP